MVRMCAFARALLVAALAPAAVLVSVATLFLAAALVLPGRALADGSVPPQPYRYLHPPPALKGSNLRPESGVTTVRVQGGSAVEPVLLFTNDQQVGVGTHTGDLSTDASAT